MLGISPSASEKEIKEVYRKMCMKYHPDRNPGNKDEAERRFKEVSEAYRMLSESPTRGSSNSGPQDRSPPRQSAPFEGFGSPFPGFQFPGGFSFDARRGGIILDDLFKQFHGSMGAGTIKEEILMKNGKPWKKKVTKTFKTNKGTRTEITEEDL